MKWRALAISLARKCSAKNGRYDCTAHVGFYLIDKGLLRTQTFDEIRLSPVDKIMQLGRRVPLLLYIGAIILLTFMFTGSLLAKAHADGLQGWPFFTLGFYWRFCMYKSPGCSPGKLAGDFAGGAPSITANRIAQSIAPEYRTLVAIQTMLLSAQNIPI